MKALLGLIPYNVLLGGFLLIGVAFNVAASPKFLVEYFLAAVFALMALGQTKAQTKGQSKEDSHNTSRFPNKDLLAYSLLQYVAQWTLGCLLVFYALKGFFPALQDEFSSILPGGFAGGYGSAAVLGEFYRPLGFPEAFDLTTFAATIGISVAIIGGVLLTRGSGRGFASPSLPGLDFRALFILLLTLAVSLVLDAGGKLLIAIPVPLFCYAFVSGLALKRFFPRLTQGSNWRDLSTLATDLLVIGSIASIEAHTIAQYIIPVGIILGSGILMSALIFKFLGLRLFKSNAFEKSLFTWGWALGGIAIGLGLTQSLDAEKGEKILQDFGSVYLVAAPFEFFLLIVGPLALSRGYGGVFLTGLCLSLLALLIYLGLQVAENRNTSSSKPSNNR